MGEVVLKVNLVNVKTGTKKEVEFVVDTGATISVVPADILKSLEIEPRYTDEFDLADGRSTSFDVGEAVFELDGKSITSAVAFGPGESQPLLGVVVLEIMGLMVDPVSRKLVKRHLMMY